MVATQLGYLDNQDFNELIYTQLKLINDEPLLLKSGKITGTSLPARIIGGDYYDIYPLTNGKIRIVIGDVMGKGIPAALLSILTKGAFRSAAEYTKNPGETLSLINQALFKDLRKMKSFVTLFCADWDPESGEFNYANAGHQSPLIISKENAVKNYPKVSGIMVGGLPKQVYHHGSILLEKGDSVFFFTDGIVEACNKKGEHFEMNRLIEAILHYKDLGSKDLDEYVMESLNQFTEGVLQKDDITMVLLKVSS